MRASMCASVTRTVTTPIKAKASTTSTLIASSRRALIDSDMGMRASVCLGAQRIAEAAHRLNQLGLAVVDLLAQIADVGLHDIGLADVVVLPDVVQYLLLGEHALSIEQ